MSRSAQPTAHPGSLKRLDSTNYSKRRKKLILGYETYYPRIAPIALLVERLDTSVDIYAYMDDSEGLTQGLVLSPFGRASRVQAVKPLSRTRFNLTPGVRIPRRRLTGDNETSSDSTHSQIYKWRRARDSNPRRV